MNPRTERKLAAILAADVVGYSRLIGDDEAGTIARLKALRNGFIEPLIADHRGRVVKLMGDGALVEFASAVDAVECAVAIQRGVVEHQAAVPGDRRLAFRIGINIGDIIVEDGDILGDGVNVAARLEGLAEPGSICVARNVWNQVKAKLDLAFEPMGAHRVKNIAERVTAYRIDLDAPGRALRRRPLWASRRWQAAAAAAALVLVLGAGGAWYGLRPSAGLEESAGAAVVPTAGALEAKPALPLPEKPSIAVLPLDNLSGEERYERLADGLADDIITDLSRFRDLFVIARNSSFVYRGKPTDIRQIARELGVHYVLEGSLQTDGDRVRITAQLIDATTGNHIWSERYERPLDDIFALQNEVTQTIAASIGGHGGAVARAGQETTRRKPPHNLEAYDYYLLASEYRQLATKEGNEKAQQLAQEAIKVDPNFARAYIALAQTYNNEIDFVYTKSRHSSMTNWLRAIQRAISLDPSDSEAHLSLAIYYSYENEFDRSLAQLEEAIELNPNNADMLSKAGGNLLPFLGRPEEGVGLVERAMRLNPHHPDWYYNTQRNAYFFAREFEKAIAASRSKRNPETPYGLIIVAMSYAQLGRHAEAAATAAEALQHYSDYSAERELSDGGGFARETELNLFLDANRKAGLPVCATEAQLQKYAKMKRLPQCELQRAKS